MDFHTLSRRELQALCKKNKIPANTTNIAMADALQSLPTVEGLEEFLANPGADYPETPAKSMTATPSVARTAKQTTRTGLVKNDLPKAAPPSACAKPSIARSTQRKVESSAATGAYSTRRSTRLLEKQMDQLSLKDNEVTVDSTADLTKDSQTMQRQFSQDLDSSVSDASNMTIEVVDEPDYVVVPLQNKELVNMDAVLDVEQESKNVVDHPMQVEDVADEQMDIVSPPNMISAVQTNEIQMDMDEATHEEVTVNAEEALESEAVNNSADFSDAIQVVDPQIKLEESIIVDEVAVISADLKSEVAPQSPKFSDDEFDFLSESEDDESEIDEDESDQLAEQDDNVTSLSEPDDSEDDSDISEEQVDQLVKNDDMVGGFSNTRIAEPATRSPLMLQRDQVDNVSALSDDSEDDSDISEEEQVNQLVVNDDMVDGFSNTKFAEPAAKSPLMLQRELSPSKSPVPVLDNKENNLQAKALQSASSAAAKTPLERKSLRALKKMLKEQRKQAEDKKPVAVVPLQVHAENV